MTIREGETSGRSRAWREGLGCVEGGEKWSRAKMQHSFLVGREAIHTWLGAGIVGHQLPIERMATHTSSSASGP